MVSGDLGSSPARTGGEGGGKGWGVTPCNKPCRFMHVSHTETGIHKHL